MKFPWNKNEFVVCADCSILLLAEKASKIYYDFRYANYFRYYCPTHKREYTRVNSSFDCFKEFRVTQDGTPVGYKKIKIHETQTKT